LAPTMYYNYYQSLYPSSWGSPTYEFGAPPVPQYIPQSSWGGTDYYRAQWGYGGGYDDPDISYFDRAYNRIKNAFGVYGVGEDKARFWHRRVYGGLVDMQELSPLEIGAAAGYEAMRIWDSHRAFYQAPLAYEMEREKDALAGIAAGEAEKLMAYQGYYGDYDGHSEALEVSIATAERIFENSVRDDYRGGGYEGRLSGSLPYGGSYGQQYVPSAGLLSSSYGAGGVYPAGGYLGVPSYGAAGYGAADYGAAGYGAAGYGAPGSYGGVAYAPGAASIVRPRSASFYGYPQGGYY